jgi:shikimate dehydrogenase
VWGSPIEHSLSPVLHEAAYRALGLTDWSYERRDVDERGFAAAFAGLGPEWRGLSLTMPLKEVAATVAQTLGGTARETGAVNTLVREGEAWTGHNTDVHGIVAALAEVGCTRPETAIVVGSGATARSALRALEECGVHAVTLMVRGAPRPATMDQAQRAGIAVTVVGLGEWSPADVVISTVPPEAVPVDRLPASGSPTGTVLDVVYGGGRTPLQEAAARQGWQLAAGTSMLLHQAVRQVELMTGCPGPVEAMRTALALALQSSRP